ncbi:MAG: YfhO family protein [Deltaproteobacteria bacterium]|nr:YfhO family protein [Deltaproteobacteria bacterium]MBW2360077.1 YfhO family protein [Deltaproteobacteria bacterium]
MVERAGPSEASDRRIRVLAPAGMALVTAVFWIAKFALPGELAGLTNGDLFSYYYPAYLELAQSWRSGHLPLWNPHHLAGIPHLAALQAGPLYPPHAVLMILPVAWGMAIMAVAHLWLAAWGTLLFCRSLGLGWAAALLAGCAVTMGQAYPAMTFFPNLLESAAWLPLGCALCVGLVEAPRRRSIAALAGVYAMSLLAGYPQFSVFTAYAWGIVLVTLLLWRRCPPQVFGAALAGLAAAGLLGIGLAAVQLVPSMELIGEGPRDGSLLIAERMFPFGVPRETDLLSALDKHIFQQAGGTQLGFGFGVLALLLAPVALLNRGRVSISLGFFALFLFFCLLALGPVTPLFDWLLHLPGLGSFRLPQRGLFIAAFAMAVLCGLALDQIETRLRDRPGNSVSSGKLRPVVPIVLMLLVLGEYALARPSFLRVHYLSGPEQPVEGALRDAWRPDHRPEQKSRGTDIRIYHAPSALAPWLDGTPARVWSPQRGLAPVIPPKLAGAVGNRAFGGYEPINTRRQAEYYDYFVHGQATRSLARKPFAGLVKSTDGLIERRRLLDLAAVRWITLPASEVIEHIRELSTLDFRNKVWTGRGNLYLYENTAALPRAYLSASALPAPPGDLLFEGILSEDFDPYETTFVEGAAGLPEEVAAKPAELGSVRFIEDGARRVELEVDARTHALLVLADTHYPGWQAEIDGERVPILPANHLFRAVAVKPGNKRVVFSYRPRSLWIGAVISLASLGVLLLLARKPRGSPTTLRE